MTDYRYKVFQIKLIDPVGHCKKNEVVLALATKDKEFFLCFDETGSSYVYPSYSITVLGPKDGYPFDFNIIKEIQALKKLCMSSKYGHFNKK